MPSSYEQRLLKVNRLEIGLRETDNKFVSVRVCVCDWTCVCVCSFVKRVRECFCVCVKERKRESVKEKWKRIFAPPLIMIAEDANTIFAVKMIMMWGGKLLRQEKNKTNKTVEL